MEPKKQLYRSDDAMIGGICSGLADYFNIDSSIIRIVAVVALIILAGIPALVYIIALFIIPRQPLEAARLIDVKPSSSGEFARLQDHQVAPGAAWVISNSQSFDAVEQNSMESDEPKSIWQRRGPSAALTLGFMLAGIGAFALLGAFINTLFWDFWPVVVIIFGVLTVFTPGYRGWRVSRAGNGILLVTLGVILLFWSLGFLPSRAFVFIVIMLWPFLLISLGLIILGGILHKDLLKLIACLLLSLSLILGIWTIGQIGGDYLLQLPFLPTYPIKLPPSPIPWP